MIKVSKRGLLRTAIQLIIVIGIVHVTYNHAFPVLVYGHLGILLAFGIRKRE